VNPDTQEVEIRRTLLFKASPSKKVSETPISTNELGVMVCACHPSYSGGIGLRLAPGKKHETLTEK
jgi:hypothetical protein